MKQIKEVRERQKVAEVSVAALKQVTHSVLRLCQGTY